MVVTLPSITDAESFGMVLAEANACARPVVGSRVGGIPDFVRHGENGLLAEPSNARSLAAALTFILRNPEAAQRMGARGREIVLAGHNWDASADATERILLSASRDPRARRVPG
jgi:glycosyltransferase involved in cell wall biosynthesis